MPRFISVLVDRMAAVNAERGEKPTALDTRVRHSDGGKCARAIAFQAAGVPKSSRMDLAGVWVTSLGSEIHEMFQAALLYAGLDAEIEPKVRIRGLDASGHADAVIVVNGRKILYELKTTGGFAYKHKVGERGPAEGPNHANIVQAALNAKAVNADEMIIGFLATEAISRSAAARKGISEIGRIGAEWTFTRAAYEAIAETERVRLQRILDLLDAGLLAERSVPVEIPDDALITDPRSGRWEIVDDRGAVADLGTWWGCNYCSWQDVCATTGSGVTPVSVVIGGDRL